MPQLADNVSITPGSGVTVASDDIGGIQHQQVKIEHGIDGTAIPVSTTNPLPTQLHSGTIDSIANLAGGTVTLSNPGTIVQIAGGTVTTTASFTNGETSALGTNSSNEASNSSYTNWSTNTWTGAGEQNDYSYVSVDIDVDEDGTLYYDFSVDGTNWSTFPSAGFTIVSGTKESPHTAMKAGRYFRPRFVGSGGRTYFRLYTYYSNTQLRLNSPLNLSMRADNDGMIVKSAHQVQYQTTPSSVADGDFDVPSITRHKQIRTRDQVSLDLQDCNDYTDFTILGNDTANLADSSNHQFGTGAITFDKVDGAANTVYAGVSFALSSLDIQELFEDGGYVGLGVYLPSITNVTRIILRLGTDSSNYNEWRWEVADLTASVWNQLRAATGRPATYAGTGWNTADIDYGAVLIEFGSQSNTLAGIVVDNIHLVSGRVTDVQQNVAITSSVSGSKVDLSKVSNNAVAVNTGNADTGTQRVVLASDQPAVPTTTSITGIAHGIKTVTTAGTDVALASSTTCKRVVIQAQTDNTGWIAVGTSGVDATEATGSGVLLGAGDAFEIDIDNLADIYIDATVNGEGVRYTYFT